MARNKQSRRVSAGSRLVIEVGSDDPFPPILLDYILALPTTKASSYDDRSQGQLSIEPLSKRRKLDPVPNISICVAKGEILISRQYEEIVSPLLNSSHVYEDVASRISLRLRDGRLCIDASSTEQLDGFTTCMLLQREDLKDAAAEILHMAGSDQGKGKVGAIWKTTDVALERDGYIIRLRLSLRLFWNETLSPYLPLRRQNERKFSQNLIKTFFPTPTNSLSSSSWSPLDFYAASHVPPKEDAEPLSIDVTDLDATLYPYQKRSLQWLLRREGVKWSSGSLTIQPLPKDEVGTRIDAFRAERDANGDKIYVSDLFQTVARDITLYEEPGRAVKGGILAEEMGLGKTLEIIGLILLHKRPVPALSPPLPGHEKLVLSGATFIVTPKSLQAQWVSELSRHAPRLRVKCYNGCRGVGQEDETNLINELAGYDVVITTYNVLSTELHFALSPPDRPRRQERAYRRITSPLMQISWWRVCLDEAQMIENGVSQAATLAKTIPRINAWGITGTPVKDDIKDLLGLLSFLRFEPYASATQIWQSITMHHKPLFQQLFNSISIRHTKALVRNEISLPPQKRFVISMPFTAVEEQHYRSLHKEMTKACNLEIDGTPLVDDWEPGHYEGEMRLWLNRLRQTALHPEVGVYGRRVLGNKERPMRTVEEVLDAMLEQSQIAMRIDERAYLSSKLVLGQLLENSPRVQEALEIWEQVRDETKQLVSDAQTELRDALRQDRVNEHQGENSFDGASDSGDESDEGMEFTGKMGEFRNRLRLGLELHHKAVFFCANAYFQIKDNPQLTVPESDEFSRWKRLEDEGYEDAKVVRRMILREGHGKATRLMNKIGQKASEQSFTDIPELVIGPGKGIESGNIVDSLTVLYEELNEQANVIDEWREQLITLLLKPLIDEEGDVETTGEELNDSAKIQDEVMVYVQALRAIIADRQDAITGQKNELIKHETEISSKMAMEGEGPAPEKLLELFRTRADIKLSRAKISMRGAVSELRNLISRLTRNSGQGQREALESKIALDLIKRTQSLFSAQNKAVISLEAEIEGFKRAMNARLGYYRQLQAVSDDVLPSEVAKTETNIQWARKTVADLHRKFLSGEAKHRYLLNLKETGSESNEPRICVICQMPFVTGVLTVCGHQFCKQCMMTWFKAHHNCPVCKRALKVDNLHDITLRPRTLQVHGEETNISSEDVSNYQKQHQSTSKRTMIYSEFNAAKLEEMRNIELDGPSFTTKVDTLVRHLLWLRESDPGAKSVVFSQYKDFLNVLRNAFAHFRVGFASIDDPRGISSFKEDPAVECFLLHARAHSSGLNLTNASHVFLCEPLLNTALELQAIARVDRIGQQHETTVWLYIVSGTVEESIYDLSVRRRMEHMGRHLKGKSKESTPELLDASIEEANTLEMEHAALSKLMSRDRSAGEMVDRSDLWECLFGQVARKDGEARPVEDSRLHERVVMSYLGSEAAETRRRGK